MTTQHTVEGKCGIKATVLADSINSLGNKLTAFEIEYPRIVLAELNTHCMLARCSASSRAIPFEKMKQQLTGRPVRFGAANPGMQDKGEEHNAPVYNGEFPFSVEEWWEGARAHAIFRAQALFDAGYHKQVYNRLTEPFQMMRTVISATEWDNFFWLRNDGAADPTLHELARCMQEAKEQSNPNLLMPGEWHLPYIYARRFEDNILRYFLDYEDYMQWNNELTLEEAQIVSVARTAAVSFRNEDYGVVKSKEVFNRLIEGDRKHASAFEHAGTPMAECQIGRINDNHSYTWEPGVTHLDRDLNLWSAKFKGFIQYRKLIPGENYTA